MHTLPDVADIPDLNGQTEGELPELFDPDGVAKRFIWGSGQLGKRGTDVMDAAAVATFVLAGVRVCPRTSRGIA